VREQVGRVEIVSRERRNALGGHKGRLYGQTGGGRTLIRNSIGRPGTAIHARMP
jgi:hypothetical protein